LKGAWAIAAILGLAAAAWLGMTEAPHWQGDGTRAILGPPLNAVNAEQLDPASFARIRIEGDSNVLADHLPRLADGSRPPAFGAVLERAGKGRLAVVVRGTGGDTAAMGARRWAATSAPADLVILVYGTNDADPRGLLSRRQATPLPEYTAVMRRLIRRHRARGATVLVLGPLAGGSWAIARRLDPYRRAARSAAVAEGASFLDSRTAFAECSAAGPLLTRDALHLNARGHACLGRWLAERLSPPPRARAVQPACAAS